MRTAPAPYDPTADVIAEMMLANARQSDRAFAGAREWLTLARVARDYGRPAAVVQSYAAQARRSNRLGLEARREGR